MISAPVRFLVCKLTGKRVLQYFIPFQLSKFNELHGKWVDAPIVKETLCITTNYPYSK